MQESRERLRRPIEGIDYFITLTPFDLGARSHGMTLLNPDGTFTVLLDSNATYEQRRRALKHEVDHIAEDDMFGDKDIREVEPELKRKTAHSSEELHAVCREKCVDNPEIHMEKCANFELSGAIIPEKSENTPVICFEKSDWFTGWASAMSRLEREMAAAGIKPW